MAKYTKPEGPYWWPEPEPNWVLILKPKGGGKWRPHLDGGKNGMSSLWE